MVAVSAKAAHQGRSPFGGMSSGVSQQRNAGGGMSSANKVDGEYQKWLPQATRLARSKERKMVPSSECFHSQRNFLQIPAALAYTLKLVKKHSSYMVQVFFKLLSAGS